MKTFSIKSRWLALCIALTGIVLQRCAKTTEPHPDCCYNGHVELVHLGDLLFELEDGTRLGYRDVFPGFKADHATFTLSLDFMRADIDLVIYPVAANIMPRYDANEDRLIEHPELTTLYLVEGARGLGHRVKRIGTDSPVNAVVLPQTELGGLTRYVRARRADMNPLGRRLFEELELLGLEIDAEVEGPVHHPSSIVIFN